MAETIRVGKVSSIDYEHGMISVLYEDKNGAVTGMLPTLSNGQYYMPGIGDMVAVAHLSNGTSSGIVLGTILNEGQRAAYTGQGQYCQECGDGSYIRGQNGSIDFSVAAGTISVDQIIGLLNRVTSLEQRVSSLEARI